MRLGGGGPTGGQAATARARLPNAGPPGALPKPQRNGWAVQRLAAYRGSHCVGAARVPAWPPRWSGGAQRWGGPGGSLQCGLLLLDVPTMQEGADGKACRRMRTNDVRWRRVRMQTKYYEKSAQLKGAEGLLYGWPINPG